MVKVNYKDGTFVVYEDDVAEAEISAEVNYGIYGVNDIERIEQNGKEQQVIWSLELPDLEDDC